MALNFFATAFFTALLMLILVRLAGGSMQSNTAVCNAYMIDITALEQNTNRFSMSGTMFGVGFIFGKIMGGLLSAVNLRLPFIVADSLALINLMCGYFVLPE